MDIAVRSYLIAGVATIGVGALALSPVAQIPERAIPTIAAPTQLTGAVSDVVENAKIFVDGYVESFFAAGVFALLGILPAVPELPADIIDTAKDHQLPNYAENRLSGLVTALTGVKPPSVPQNPGGQLVPTVPNPNYEGPVQTPTKPAEFVVIRIPANLAESEISANLIEKGITVGPVAWQNTYDVWTARVQANGLVRSAALGSAQRVVDAVANHTSVRNALKEGGIAMKHAVFGKPANSTDAPAGSIKNLGAIKTVKSTTDARRAAVKKAIHDKIHQAAPSPE